VSARRVYVKVAKQKGRRDSNRAALLLLYHTQAKPSRLRSTQTLNQTTRASLPKHPTRFILMQLANAPTQLKTYPSVRARLSAVPKKRLGRPSACAASPRKPLTSSARPNRARPARPTNPPRHARSILATAPAASVPNRRGRTNCKYQRESIAQRRRKEISGSA
jgi:hypothetical protein